MSNRFCRAAWMAWCVVLAGCGAGGPTAGDPDAGAAPAVEASDGGQAAEGSDAGSGGTDAGAPVADAGTPGVGSPDAGALDGGSAMVPATPAAGGDTCAAAPVLAAGRWRVDTTGAAGDFNDMAGPCGTGASLAGPDLFFTLDVPAGHLVRVGVEAGSFSGARIALVRDCGALANSCERTGSSVVSWANPDAATAPLKLVVDGLLAQHAGEANLVVAFEPLSQQPAGATCAAPLTLAVPGSASGSTAGRDNLVDGYVGPTGVCNRYGTLPGLGGGGDVTWVVEVPAGRTASVSVTAQGGWDVVLAALDGCGPAAAQCAQWSDPGSLQLVNTGTTPRTWFVVVDGFHPYSAGSYTLQSSLL